jgi:hypothetical protein
MNAAIFATSNTTTNNNKNNNNNNNNNKIAFRRLTPMQYIVYSLPGALHFLQTNDDEDGSKNKKGIPSFVLL